MTWKKGLLLGLISAALASTACIAYDKIYSAAFYVDFSKVLNTTGIVSTCILACILMSVTYVVLINWKGEKFIAWANLFFSIISFVSIVGVLSYTLPLDVEFPEMFPGMAIPMHFFPVLAFLSVYPFFRKQEALAEKKKND